ncbi:hypothetical protein ACFPVY_03345 [Flavobacterium qiangtangense]|uniref:Bacteriocin immunity protein n=1 Tax=Flavobacterium qiangtangense TaxID=1442595 RepID=A0ABW1PJS8_9FLAO
MEPKYLKLLKKLLQAEGKDAEEICGTILMTKLELPHFSPSLVSMLEVYYKSIASEYCTHKTDYNKSKLEKIISEIEGLLF